MQRKASIEAKNEAETQIYSAESSLREYRDKLPQNVVDNINTEISNVRSSLESEDAEEIRSKVSTAKSGFAFGLCNATAWGVLGPNDGMSHLIWFIPPMSIWPTATLIIWHHLQLANPYLCASCNVIS